MGFKTAGFPSFGFNPIGFRKSGSLLQDLIKNCGLIQYATPVTDKVGKSSRDSVRGKALVGNGSTYVILNGITPDALPDNYNISGEAIYNDNALTLPAFWGASNDNPSRFYLATDNSDTKDIILGFYDTVSRLDVNLNLGDLVRWSLEVTPTTYEITVNGVTSGTIPYNKTSITSQLRMLSRSGVSESNHKILKFEITDRDTGKVSSLAIESRQSDGVIPLNGSDGSVILCEQFLSPATPVVNSLQESYFDALGGTIADGSQYLDVGLTVQADIGTPIITNHAFTASGNISPQYNGRVKYDNLVCDVSGTPTGLEFASGRYIRLSQPYDGFAQYDTNRIATEADGTPKVLAYDTMADNTLNQYFTSADRQKLMFFKVPISGECETKALKELGFNESLLALDVDGDYAIDADGDYVYEGS